MVKGQMVKGEIVNGKRRDGKRREGGDDVCVCVCIQALKDEKFSPPSSQQMGH